MILYCNLDEQITRLALTFCHLIAFALTAQNEARVDTSWDIDFFRDLSSNATDTLASEAGRNSVTLSIALVAIDLH